MRLISFNINGIRARPHQLERITRDLAPDVIGLQETKVRDEEFPRERVESLGYRPVFHGQKGHYGVALLSRQPPLTSHLGFPHDGEDAQRRLVSATYRCPDGGELTVINGYFPQGESRDHPVKFPAKQQFYADLIAHLEENFDPMQRIALMGDFNISHRDQDIGIGEENRKRWLRTGKCSFLPEEREWFDRLLAWGLTDLWRARHPETQDRFSWFDYRSRGFEREPRRGLRIDTILGTAPLLERLVDADIDYAIRAMDRPSDHCPVWATLDLS